MREQPPARLVELLERLDLVTPAGVRAVYGRARRLARDLPLFESVWVDALAQSRLITPFQAAELNAGRSEALGVGKYVLLDRLQASGYADNFRGREKTSGREMRVILPRTGQRQPAEIAAGLERLVEKSSLVEHEGLALIASSGMDGRRVWASCPVVEGTSAGEWMIPNGRFPPEVALEIARQMVVALRSLERHECIHGDLHCRDLSITLEGRVVLSAPGLRGVVRPEEGFSHADLQPEAYDYLAPERITLAAPSTVQSDLYACGYVWWHLLTGRPPFPGGNSLIKLRAVDRGKVTDIAALAPDAPPPLIAAIGACTRREPSRRPESFAQLVETLGSPTREGRKALARLISQGPRVAGRKVQLRPAHGSPPPALRLAAASVALAAVLLIALASWRHLGSGSVISGDAAAPAADAVPEANGRKVGTSRPRPFVPGVGRDGNRSVGTAEHALYRPRRSANAVVPTSAGAADSQGGRASDNKWTDVDRDRRTRPSQTGGESIALATARPVRWDEIPLRAGAVVHATGGGRARVVVPSGGFPIDVENVRFERIDFIRTEASPGVAATKLRQANGDQEAFIHLRALRARFEGCSFDALSRQGARPSAIVWDTRDHTAGDQIALPTGVLEMNGCAFRGVAAGVECRTAGALVLEATNLLFLGPGPLVRMYRVPRIEEPVVLSLHRTTLRGAAAMLECVYTEMDEEPGNISIRSRDCAFAPSEGGALLSFHGKQDPDALVSVVHWTGQGSVMTPSAAVVRWHAEDDQTHVLAEDELDVAGLVRSEIEFAGDVDAGAAASQVVRWQGPIRSLEPPGVGELPLELQSPQP